MPDISMCANDKCHLAKMCYRHEAKPSDWQAWMDFKPDDNGVCKNFMEIRK